MSVGKSNYLSNDTEISNYLHFQWKRGIFTLQNELSKIKISIPFNELLRNNEYIEKITRMVGNGDDCQLDTLEVTYDAPTIILGPRVDTQMKKMYLLSM